MPFECKKYHCKCKAECCGLVPIPLSIWSKNQHRIQREVKNILHIQKDGRKDILPVTEELYCPFLKDDLSCAIYEERPEICKKFGDESNPLLCCPMQDKEGKERG